MKPKRAFFGVFAFVFFLTALPVSTSVFIKGSGYSFFSGPLALSKNASGGIADLWNFRKNARENKFLRNEIAKLRFERFQREELLQENARLTKLLQLKKTTPLGAKKIFFARVIGRSPATWDSVLLVDKGTRHGVHTNMMVLTDFSLVGKVIEAGPKAAKILLMTDPSSRIGVLIQRTRQEGVLFGTASGECRMKYISLDAELKPGDIVETAGFGGFFPKGLRIGVVERAWKERGQIYQVAKVKPLANLDRLEEVVLIDY